MPEVIEDDLVRRLRTWAGLIGQRRNGARAEELAGEIFTEAADEIVALRTELTQMTNATLVFAAAFDALGMTPQDVIAQAQRLISDR